MFNHDKNIELKQVVDVYSMTECLTEKPFDHKMITISTKYILTLCS